jgi:hypothetical protein
MRSLFLVSLPRSLSSLLYQRIRDTLGFAEPRWTSDGEILNLHRLALMPGEGAIEGVRFLRRSIDPERFDRLLTFLDHATVRTGFLYKDVVHPFVSAEWLPRSGLHVLHLERPLADVAWSMLDHGWLYPRAAADGGGDGERQLLTGLARARRALACIGAPVLTFDEIVHDEEPLARALRSMYGDDIPCPAYLDDGFRAVRLETLARRRT